MNDDAVEAYVRAAAALAGLQLDAESFEAVTANTRVLREFAALFAEIDLPDELDPATVLRL
jgi:hypothetical protein